MAHNHGNKAPGTRRTESKKKRNSSIQTARAGKKESQRKKRKDFWAKDESYQKKQKKRKERLEKKLGYKTNIEDGIRLKERCKEQKQIRVRQRKEEAKRGFRRLYR